MPQFVLLRHETPPTQQDPSHWDLMLEVQPGGALATWKLETLPRDWRQALAAQSHAAGAAGGQDHLGAQDSNNWVEARRLADHRRKYLEYEGSLSGDRGAVHRCDRGACAMIEVSAVCVRVELDGEFIRGMVALQPVDAPHASGAGGAWRLSVAVDSAAD